MKRSSSETVPRVARIGYARVSTSEEHLEAQAARLRENDRGQVFADHSVTGKAASDVDWRGRWWRQPLTVRRHCAAASGRPPR
jgi:resolvase-like protein